GTKEAVVSEDGRTAFLAVTDGFAAVDVSDPAAPVVVSETRDILADREQGPLRRIWDVKCEDDRLVVASQGGANGDLFAFVVYDVSDPANPRQQLVKEVPGSIHNCDLHDGHVYVTGLHANHHSEETAVPSVPVEIYDAREEGAPKVADWSPLDRDEAWADVPARNRVIHDVSVVAGRAYLAYWDAGAVLLDVSDPTTPSFLSRVGEFSPEDLAAMSAAELDAEATEGPEGNAHYVTGSGDGSLFGVGKEAWDDPDTEGGGPGGIDLYDASDPTDPAKRATIGPEPSPDETYGGVWTTAHNFEIRGDRLYSSWYRAGVKIHDVSDPENPELLAWWLRPRATSFWTAQAGVEGEFFVASSADDPGARLSESRESLYTFPDTAGEQADRPSLSNLVTPTVTSTETAGGPSPSRTEDVSGSDEGGPTPTATSGTEPTPPEPTPTDRETATGSPGERSPTGTTRTDGQPGFGVLAALGGAAIGAYRYLSE
ncbi:MAG: LVIVD repeat-containing protein, partial [Halobacteriales archaeon]